MLLWRNTGLLPKRVDKLSRCFWAKIDARSRFVGKLNRKIWRLVDPRPEACLKTPNVDAWAEKPNKNGKFSTRALLPTLKFYFVLHQEVQLFLHLLYQSSNSIFNFNLQILSSTSIFEFSLQILSSTSIFALRFARLSFQVNKTCWKSPKLNRRILAFFEKMSLAGWFWAFFEKIAFDV